MSPRAVAAALFYLLLAVTLRFTYGTYHAAWLGCLAAGFVAFAAVTLRRITPEQESIDATRPSFVVWTIVLLSAALLCLDPLIVAPASASAVAWLRSAMIVAASMIGLCWVAWRRARPDASGWTWCAVVAAWVALVAARAAVLVADPQPGIDVYVTNTVAADHALRGVNPYTAEYPDVYAGKYGYPAKFYYWPAYLLPAMTARGAMGDVRWVTIVADVAAAVALWSLARRRGWPAPTAAAVPLLWLAHPVSLLVLELAWVDPLLIAGIGALAVSLHARRWLLAGIVFGGCVAVKQYGVLLALPLVAHLWARERAALPKVLAAAAVTAGVLIVPFVALDARGFYDSTIAVYLHAAIRPDALSLVAWAKNTAGLEPPGWLLGAVVLAAVGGMSVWLARRDGTLADWAAVTALSYGVLFLCGKQAFCNYYYLVAFVVLVGLVAEWGLDRRVGAAAKPGAP